MRSPKLQSVLSERPLILAIAGSNGSGKTTFYKAFLRTSGLKWVNADEIARVLDIPASNAATLADHFRNEMLQEKESFIFETVFSDPVQEKIRFLQKAKAKGYTVVLIFLGIPSAADSETRVSMRVAQGGHDVPDEKIRARFPRTLKNLKYSLSELPYVWILDNSRLGKSPREVAFFEDGKADFIDSDIPDWFRKVLEL